ncbi:ABC transporter substrate-binding protein [Steroidobacter sp. S1-65]|uniref:ABC transporter substrate-binding protein n=1 Tax=Steroidobacter gossypii TaxID=2805490 RepID=A0ABS1WW22_9GAMM|nr:CmpA/NrtA family ABC transporter substrate-binding protein [Steroidobacter gossypii]MBM0105170.1 ABC transporter substrate-binding protein [Steroidobacter gossypii]
MNPAQIEHGTTVVGFIPLLDCAPLAVAVEKGFAAEQGLDLRLVRETSWANIRDRVVVGHFDAAHMLGPMAIASTLGVGHLKVPMAAPLSLGLGGSGITVSLGLWDSMTAEGASLSASPRALGEALRTVVRARERAQRQPLTFAMVYPFSSHNYELRYWLAACGIDPDRDVRVIVIPPPLLVDAMREGQIDGFCVGEPWNSLAVAAGVGCIALPTTAIWRLSPEKVLGCRLEWTQRHPDRLRALVRAVYKSALWCEQPENHAELSRLLAEPRFVGAPAEILLRGLSNRLCMQPGGEPQRLENFYLPASRLATFPWVSHALWFYSQMVRWGQVGFDPEHVPQVRATYRPDLYRLALSGTAAEIPTSDTKIEGESQGRDGFFDGARFDPNDLSTYARKAE